MPTPEEVRSKRKKRVIRNFFWYGDKIKKDEKPKQAALESAQ